MCVGLMLTSLLSACGGGGQDADSPQTEAAASLADGTEGDAAATSDAPTMVALAGRRTSLSQATLAAAAAMMATVPPLSVSAATTPGSALGALVATSTSTTATTQCSAQVATNWNSYERPFSARSPWNIRPAVPTFGTATVPASLYYPAVQQGAYSNGAFKARTTDAAMVVYGNNSKGLWNPDTETYSTSVTIPRWTADVIPASGLDGHAEIVDPVNNVVHSFWQLRQQGNRWEATQYAWTPLNGRGTGNPAHYFQGARAAGLSTLGGLIRTHEVNDGADRYAHALAISMTFNGLGTGYVWPATATDSNAASTNTGQVPMGARLMLPPGFDAASVTTPALRKIVNTLQSYGGLVVDRNHGTPFVIYVENGAPLNLHPNGWNATAAAELDRIRAALRPLASAGGWVDGLGRVFQQEEPLPLLSMRGTWTRSVPANGLPSLVGAFDTWQQALVFPASSQVIEQANWTGRAWAGIEWAAPKVGASYQLSSVATGGGQVRVQIRQRSTGSVAWDSAWLGHGETVRFAWPLASDFHVVTMARSGGQGVVSTVRGELKAVGSTETGSCWGS
jgi:hypothetical protein